MARSFSNARFLSSLVGVQTISVSLGRLFRTELQTGLGLLSDTESEPPQSAAWRGYAAASQGVGCMYRRGYAAASQGVGLGSAAGAAMANKAGEDAAAKSGGAWVPDPVTGYYKPENQANQIDVAELREMLLKRNVRQH